MKWTSTVIITIIIELFSKIQERLYNFHIIQADYDSQPLSQTSSTSKRRSSRPGSYEMDINGVYMWSTAPRNLGYLVNLEYLQDLRNPVDHQYIYFIYYILYIYYFLYL